MKMSFWVYKCNANDHPSHVCRGDWEEVFSQNRPMPWGKTEFIPAFRKLSVGDLVIAYQTDRNEIIGLAEVVKLRRYDEHQELIVRPVERIGVHVRPLKKLDKRIAALSCFKQAKIATIYDISTADAWHLLNVAVAQAGIQKAIYSAS